MICATIDEIFIIMSTFTDFNFYKQIQSVFLLARFFVEATSGVPRRRSPAPRSVYFG